MQVGKLWERVKRTTSTQPARLLFSFSSRRFVAESVCIDRARTPPRRKIVLRIAGLSNRFIQPSRTSTQLD